MRPEPLIASFALALSRRLASMLPEPLFSASRLASDQADLASTGSGGITANVRQSLIAQNGGSGGIRVYGNPG